MASQITHQLSNFSSTKHKYFNCFSVFRNPPIRISHSISAGRPVGCYKLLQVNFALKVCAKCIGIFPCLVRYAPHIGTFVVYFSLKWGKKIDKNVVKYRNRKGAKINMIQRLFLSMLPQKHLKIEKRTISNTEIRWTVALLQFSSLCSSCSSSPCIDKMDCQFYLFQNELFAGHTHNRPIDENNFLYFQSFIEKATFILVLINLKYLFQ